MPTWLDFILGAALIFVFLWGGASFIRWELLPPSDVLFRCIVVIAVYLKWKVREK
jgi:hypothetical protein